MKQENIGFYGGTFDPIHLGHLNLLVELKEARHLDEVWVCPAGCSPFKQEGLAAAAEHRLSMARLATADIPFVKVLEVELSKTGPSYTIDTLNALSEQMKAERRDVRLHLMLGDDSITSLPGWKQIDRLVTDYPLLIGKRLKTFPTIDQFPSSIYSAIERGLTPTSLFEISATQIRTRLLAGLYCGHLLHSKVLDYIHFHQLYSRRSKN
jgi:nicotinate-nucleotide adenylyltransferase